MNFMGSHKENYHDLPSRRHNIIKSAPARVLIAEVEPSVPTVDYQAIPKLFLTRGQVESQGSIEATKEKVERLVDEWRGMAASGNFDFNDLSKTQVRLNWANWTGNRDEKCLICNLILTK